MAQISHATINVINGEEFGDSPQASVHVLGKRGNHGGETLLVFLDLPGATPTLCADITRGLTDGYARAPGGVTSALRLAIKLASDKAAQFNKGVLPTQRVEGSISCAVISDTSVVIAQTGPAIAYVRGQDGAFERIDPQPAVAAQIVGATTNADVSFDNVTHQHGNVYLLTGQRSFVGGRDDLVSACMGKGDARMAAGYLNANVKQGRMIGLAFGAAERDGVPAAQPAPKRAVPTQAHAPEPVIERRREPAYHNEPDAMVERGAGFNDFAAGAATRAADVGSDVKAGLNQAAQSVKRSLSQFGGKMLPDTAAFEDKAQRSKTTLFVLAATAVLVPILVIGVAVPAYYQYSGEAERREAQKTINLAVEAAKAAKSPTEVKSGWAQVIQQVDAYEKANPKPEEIARYAEVRTQARAQVDALFKIGRIKPAAIAQYEQIGRRRIAASSLGVYALNLDVGNAEFMVVSPDKGALVGKSVPVQFTSNISGGLALSDLAWATNQDSRWRTEGVVMFSPREVYEYNRATGRAAPLQFGAVEGKTPTKLAAGELYNNQAYLLDSGAGQIWRFPVGSNGFGKGSTYFRSPFEPMKQGVDLAIDGAIYVLSSNGSIQKFFNRQPQKFDISGLPEPIGRPVAIAVSGGDPARGNVFVLDAQAGAVLVFDKAGQFIKQFRGAGDELINATDMSFDAASNAMFVTSGDRLYSFKLQ
jgi:hypothetical protein